MCQLLSLLAQLDGVAHVRELIDRGVPAHHVSRAALRGDIDRVRLGVYSHPHAHPQVVRAARVGGRLAGASAAGALGVWTPAERRLVVATGRSARLLDPDDSRRLLDRDRHDVRVIWSRRRPARSVGIAGPAELVPHVLQTEPTDRAVAILDSLIRTTGLGEVDLEFAAVALPPRLRRTLTLVDSRAESGTESIVRVALSLAGIRAVPQVRVPFSDLDRMDLLVGDRLVIECDSRAHHGDTRALERDAARDLALTALGFVVLRVRWASAMFDSDGIVAAVRTLMDRGAHLDRAVAEV